MQIAIALVIAAAIGVGVHFLMPHRVTRGAALAPLAATAAGAVAWTVLTWLGLGIDNPWIWLAAVIVPLLVALALVLAVTASRLRNDERERRRLGLV